MSDVEELVALDRRVDAAEGEGVYARWKFGRGLLARRKGKQLPHGLLDELVARTGKSRTELKYRVQFAENIPTEEEVANALATWPSWHDIVNEGLPTHVVVGETGPLPGGRYRVIVADPPWRYGNKATRGAAEDHYPTMTIDALRVLDIEGRTADDAHLYLWTTNGFLHEAFELVDAWGFEYKTCLTWVKPQMGMGNYFRSSTEHILFGTRGALKTQDRTLVNWFEAPRGRHSSKPDCFYDLVEKASPGPYLELFARRARFGWDYWGNEALTAEEAA